MMDLFFVSSPFQLICAIEAREHYQSKNQILILREQINDLAMSHIEQINDRKWTHTIWLREKPGKFSLPRMVGLLRDIRKLNKQLQFNRIFFAEYSSWRMRVILNNCEHHYQTMFDDGTMTVAEYEKNIAPKRSFSVKRKSKERSLKLFGFRGAAQVETSEKFEIYTYFKLPPSNTSVLENQFEKLRSELALDRTYVGGGDIAIIGDGMTDAMNIAKYKNILSNLAAKFPDKKLFYFPHRNELPHVKESLSDIPNLEYNYSNGPIELALSKLPGTISGIYGFSSSAVISLSRIYNHIPVLFKILDSDTILSGDYLETLGIIETFFKNEGLAQW